MVRIAWQYDWPTVPLVKASFTMCLSTVVGKQSVGIMTFNHVDSILKLPLCFILNQCDQIGLLLKVARDKIS